VGAEDSQDRKERINENCPPGAQTPDRQRFGAQ
jgi:hypothetical protein